jgi:hypothetical protein
MELTLYLLVRLGINGSSSLIEDEDLTASEKSSSETHELTLS